MKPGIELCQRVGSREGRESAAFGVQCRGGREGGAGRGSEAGVRGDKG